MQRVGGRGNLIGYARFFLGVLEAEGGGSLGAWDKSRKMGGDLPRCKYQGRS